MLTVSEALDRAQMLCDAAAKAGADAADALYYCNAATSVSMRLGALEDVERSEGQDISLRVFVGQRSEEHTSELQSLMRISYAVFCLTKKNSTRKTNRVQEQTTETTA